jgi:hypothetical protein
VTEGPPTKEHAPAPAEPRGSKQIPYEGVVAQIVGRIRNEPLLFVIAIAALLLGLVTLGSGLGSQDLRLVAVLVGVLAFLGICGYYVSAAIREWNRAAGPNIVGNVRAKEMGGDAQLTGVKGPATLPTDARIRGTVDVGTAREGARATGVDLQNGNSIERP